MATREYRSERRAADAAATRAAIRTAATTLFVSQGYAATTLRQVAAEAGVAERTVYTTFDSKFDLYHHALDVATVGDELPIAVRDRPAVLEQLSAPDPRAALAAMTDYGVDLLERAGDLVWVGIEGASADPKVAEFSEVGRRETKAAMLRFAKSLEERGALRQGLSSRQAADILFAIGSPHMFRLLRRDCGWSAKRYREWCQLTLAQQLLG